MSSSQVIIDNKPFFLGTQLGVFLHFHVLSHESVESAAKQHQATESEKIVRAEARSAHLASHLMYTWRNIRTASYLMYVQKQEIQTKESGEKDYWV